ncbi:N-acetylneuraminate synthase family protein [Desulfofustis glycolicus]|uniref:N-acetylneuraminate synthase n=1 Tax=Desulfofustis glycolicus DSM 9705 TaxID=1121409 RepID=A0A1M5Y6M5_9BACT|nr:N-acetylneuraminate synthase family protein [Desulfofustis glycolicus]MCB2216860.1 N-acetylneuraminate synthase family protein [Desulfobulbaceae bacterium]SHI07730.1 N-acetylneuraminate synthase [Desulfofustis glycolicus DSM 9705]
MKPFTFENLFVLDLANNHQGEIEHGLAVIEKHGEVVRKCEVRAGLKFQFRQLDTFIHPDFKERKDIKHIPRFMETALPVDAYGELVDAVHRQGMVSICTPFDEESVDIILEMGIEVIKVASCSASDWPLLKKIAQTNRPVIISTAGLSMSKIDRLVSYFEYEKAHFALMHCVALYPTPPEKTELNQIDLLKNRFPALTVGFSTHEHPDNTINIGIAYGKGARIFERHVGFETGRHKLNKYSSTPEQIEQWITAWKQAVATCGGDYRAPADPDETASLRSLMRGVYAKKKISAGEAIEQSHVFFSMPLQDDQLASGDFVPGIVANRDYAAGTPLDGSMANLEPSRKDRIFQIMLQVKGILNQARIFIGKESAIEISHHYGLEHFREFGAVIITCINRSYCKKLIVMLPRQKHPYHFHEKKEETFQLLWGDVEIELAGNRTKLEQGDIFTVLGREWHKFHTLDGCVFEEVSTTHFDNDSFYEDERIARLPREQRKTQLDNWESATRDVIRSR